jgi:ketosteroid isomerase-like protein
MSNVNVELIGWLKEFESCVRDINYDKALNMFFPDACCFGSLIESVNSLESLFKQQWSQIWPNIKDFSFDFDRLQYKTDDQGKLACLMLPWTSLGFHKDGSSFKRPGRATILLLKNSATGQWRAQHTHFSIKPGICGITYSSKI